MKDFSEALALVLDGLAPLESERVSLNAAVGRVLAADARAVIDLPPFDRTAMDGYAVRAADVCARRRAARARRPGRGRRRGHRARARAPPRGSPPARRSRPAPTPSCASRTPTGATGVVTPPRASRPVSTSAAGPRTSRAGDVLARPGDVLTVPRLSALASAGIGVVDVPRTPRVDLIVTGERAAPAGRAAGAGEDLRVQLARGRRAGRGRRARGSSSTRRCPTTSRRPATPSSAASRATS